MKFRFVMYITLLGALAIPIGLAAQKYATRIIPGAKAATTA